jgi:CheY-like chemotaxis protein
VGTENVKVALTGDDRAIAILSAAAAQESSIFMSFAIKTALIVDDDEFFRMALRTVVTGTLGFSEVLEAENFDQATALLSGNKVDLAVFDLMMPGMAGPGSLKGVRETCALSWPPSQIGAKTSC